VRSTRGVSRVVEFIQGEPLRVEDEVIALIAAQMRDDGVVMIGGDSLHIPSGYKADETIMVTYGPLAGIAGLFKRDGDKAQRVVLLLRMLGRQFEQEFALEDTRRAFPSELAFA
jgi:transcription antitermination factor NusG